MRIGLIAPPWVPVPPVTYGGTEQVVDALARGLTGLGHCVRLFTVRESTCPVERSWLYEHAAEPMGMGVTEVAHVLAAYEALNDVDVVHDHTGLGPLVAAGLAGRPPVVATNHNPFTAETARIYRAAAACASVVAISHAQRATAPEIPVAAVIHHGIDLEQHAYGEGGGDYVLFVGRMSPDKGLHRAIEVARRAGRRLVVVSKMRTSDEVDYYERCVRPLLGDDVEMLDNRTAPQRVALLRNAVALLNPICWPKPFGLVMAEALACGTPVLAFPNGAAPEIVDDGVTGFLCRDEAAMADALTRVASIDRRACRRAAEQRFAMARMAADHVRLYEQVVARPRVIRLPGPRDDVRTSMRSPRAR